MISIRVFFLILPVGLFAVHRGLSIKRREILQALVWYAWRPQYKLF